MMGDCDSCRAAPGSVYCHADAAVLCAACDADVHSANLISHRHHRVPVIGIPHKESDAEYKNDVDGDGNQSNYAALFGEEVDEYLDLAEFNNSCGTEEKPNMNNNFEYVKSEVSEGVVPVQSAVASEGLKEEKEDEMEFGYSAALRHGVSLLLLFD